jgi:hypothetical protein
MLCALQLQDSFGKTAIFVCISPADYNAEVSKAVATSTYTGPRRIIEPYTHAEYSST